MSCLKWMGEAPPAAQPFFLHTVRQSENSSTTPGRHTMSASPAGLQRITHSGKNRMERCSDLIYTQEGGL